MGRSKFPGKPSKSVMKDRIRVLNNSESDSIINAKRNIEGCTSCCSNNKSCNSADSNINSKNNKTQFVKNLHPENGNIQVKLDQGCTSSSIYSTQTKNHNIFDDSDDKIKHIKKNCSIELEQNQDETESITKLNHEKFKPNPLCTSDKNLKKKTVTFKNILETSDDTLTFKSIHNPLNRGPLVSIMKKNCMKSHHYMPRNDKIVRPSRLTKILKNNANIDKTKFLSFRSVSLPIKSFECSDEQDDNYNSACKLFLPEEGTNNKLKDQNQNIKPFEKITSDNQSSKLLDKWKMQNLVPDEIQDESAANQPQPSKRKDGLTHSQIILRQPRLLLETQDDILQNDKHDDKHDDKQDVLNDVNDPTFPSIKIGNKNSICGVCSTTVNHKHIQQSRKYGITACEFCRTFISKISKRTITASPNSSKTFKIQCIKKGGECSITSLSRQNTRSFKKIYDERCSACWLKKCLQSFHFPSGHKLRLSSLLMETQNMDIHSINKSQEALHLKTAVDLLSEKCNNDSQANLFNTKRNVAVKENKEHSTQHQEQSAALGKEALRSFVKDSLSFELFPKTAGTENGGNTTRLLNKNAHQISNKSIELPECSIAAASLDYPKRQKIAFKGPRVKHVCRSASIALGQQMATFSNDDDESLQLMQSKSELDNSSIENFLNGNFLFTKNDQRLFSEQTAAKEAKQEVQMQFEKAVTNCADIDDEDASKKSVDIGPTLTDSLKVEEGNQNRDDDKIISNTIKNNHQNLSNKFSGSTNVSKPTPIRNKRPAPKKHSNVRQVDNKSKMISIDFWDTYVPAEVNQTGFGLILTEPLSVFALCFLCGSVDLNNLLFCVCCCEPYHSYCIQETYNNNDAELFDNKDSTFSNYFNWMCPRCTVCDTCNMSSGAKIKCQKCKKNYHNTCMGTSKGLLGADRPLICRSCLKCQFCSTTKVSKYVGNQPTCFQCFIQRCSVSTCSICQKCVGSVLDLIILECGVCNEFIHAKCEGLTEEQTNLLSSIAGDIKFVCNKCSLSNDTSKALAKQWREAVCKELRSRLLQVLKLLSKSRVADILKVSMKHNCLCGFDKTMTKFHHINEDSLKYKFNNITGQSSKCLCSKNNNNILKPSDDNSLSLLDIKKKIVNEEYVSLFDFNADMSDVIIPLKNDELLLTYKEIISEKFSWFQNETKTCTDALEEDMFDSCSYSFQQENDNITEDQSLSSLSTKLPLPMPEEKIFSALKQQNIDKRICIFCQQNGDGEMLQESRLLYYGFDSWVHVNCALWSMDVYEEFDGSLQNVHTAFSKGKIIRCVVCKNYGATIKCNVKTCSNYYHFQCARKNQCTFENESSMCCSIHSSTDSKSLTDNPITERLSASRPLHIECNKPHKKYVDPIKVQFMIGSLCVIQLGNVYIPYSDTPEAIIPINFICTRLYWSSKEPWKVIKYRVRTSIQNSSVTLNREQDRNFTVDHSKTKRLVEKDLSHISYWHSTLIRDSSNVVEKSLNIEHSYLNNLRFSKNNVDFRNETNFLDTFNEEEPQNNSDLLPPEIEEAIFEDLPNDILDGISMLDIFPKLMIHEDLDGTDGKQDKIDPSIDCFSSNIKQNLKSFTQKRELQRSNSEVFLRNVDGYRSQQRSSSVTWGCLNDNKYGFKKELSDLNLSESKGSILNCLKFEEKFIGDKKNSSKASEENANITQFKKEKIKLVQLDGANDHFTDNLNVLSAQDANSKNPVKCYRCHCTYRNFESFQRHFVNCEQMFTSESETDTSSRSPDTETSTIVVKDEFDQNPFFRKQIVSTNGKSTTTTHLSNFSAQSIFPQSINIDKPGCSTNVGDMNFNTLSSSIGTKQKVNKPFIKNSPIKSENCNFVAKNTDETDVSQNKISKNSSISQDNKNDYRHLLNQSLMFNDQSNPQKIQQQENQHQFVIIQQAAAGNSQPMYLHHVSNASSNIPQNIFPVVLSNNQGQYASVPTYTNSLVQAAPIWNSDCNVILSPQVQMLPMPSLQLPTQSPHLVSSFSLPQVLQLGSNPMLLGGTSTMDLLPNPNQLLLAAAPQPMFYGLETIVQNTVMSSQQFVSTAIQGVLSQNASFSATTTQVFKSSKFEPVSDTSTSYVVLNNVDGSAIVVPQSNMLPGLLNTNCSNDFQIGYNPNYGNLNNPHSQTIIQQSEPNNIFPLIQTTFPEIINTAVEIPTNELQETISFPTKQQTVQSAAGVKNSVHSKNENMLCQTWLQNSSTLCSMKRPYTDNASISSTITNCVNDHNASSKVSELQNTSSPDINETTLKQKVQVAPKNIKRKNTNSIPISKMGLTKVMYKNALQNDLKLKQDVMLESPNNKTERSYELLNEPTTKDDSVPFASKINYINAPVKSELNYSTDLMEIPDASKPSDTYDMPTSIANRIENRKPINLSLTKLPFTTSFGSTLHNVPTNVVVPIMQAKHSKSTTSRPTNRVLPMQSIHNKYETSQPKISQQTKCSTNKNVQRLAAAPLDAEFFKIIATPKKEEFDGVNSMKDVPEAVKSVDIIDSSENTPTLVHTLDATKIMEQKTMSFTTEPNESVLDIENPLESENVVDSKKSISTHSDSSSLENLENQNSLQTDKTSDIYSPLRETVPIKNDFSVKNENFEMEAGNTNLLLVEEENNKNQSISISKSIDVSNINLIKSNDPEDDDFRNEIENVDKTFKVTEIPEIKMPLQFEADQQQTTSTTATFSSKKPNSIESIKKTSEPCLIYEIQSEDGFSYKSQSIADVWEKVFEAVQIARRAHGLPSYPIGTFADICGVQILGLKTNALKYLIEQLPGTEKCQRYTPKYHANDSPNVGKVSTTTCEVDMDANKFGAARCEPFAKRSPYDMFSWLASRHRKQPKQIFVQPSDNELIARRCTANLPMAMKYRTLKETCKLNVGVFRSLIHGRGLFCIKDMEASEMVIEYAGELIRSTLADKRERFYDNKGIGCYMFKIDEHFVVDATMRGNAARFINHSCEPNCYSKVVDILGHKHIIIFSLRRIVKGEELTYDYKFPFEDVKIHCYCASKKCRKYLN
ncbi:histone-lysine N-methyltransferase trithorax [Episyrphus balteatus]|uniref:histone-lysine N-methyltransferase trithorax n=1 Tax=Episyrphus balteatus TaxID=286459 RepID=UPI0024860126|nr:histone-lysine N-methyltransferase trithorax [Episyrphus balteatus]